MTTPHARTSDIPGWTCPPRVRDIPQHENSWGWVTIRDNTYSIIVQDEQGYLWVDGDATLRSGLPDYGPDRAVLCWTEQGLGVYVFPGTQVVPVVCQADLERLPGRMPIAVVLPELPAHVKDA